MNKRLHLRSAQAKRLRKEREERLLWRQLASTPYGGIDRSPNSLWRRSDRQQIDALKRALRETVQNLEMVLEEGERALKRARAQLEQFD